MNNERVAKELIKLARELTSESREAAIQDDGMTNRLVALLKKKIDYIAWVNVHSDGSEGKYVRIDANNLKNLLKKEFDSVGKVEHDNEGLYFDVK